MPCRLPLALALALLAAAPAGAADTVLDASVPLTKPRKKPPRLGGPLDKVELKLWLPDGVKVVRGAVFNPFNLGQVEQKHWQEAARLWGFGVLGGNYFGVNQADYGTLDKALAEFAKTSGHPEVAHLPLCLVGMSAGAGMSLKFADRMPDRVLAVAAVCLEVGPSTEATRKIPIVTIFGEKDGRQMAQLAEKLPPQRKEGARWAMAVQWGRRHEFARANNLAMPFFDEVIRRRYPPGATPLKGPVKLRDYPDADAWLGDRAGWEGRWPAVAPAASYKGDKAQACWLPGEGVAAVWRAFVAKAPALTIKSPAGLGDGRPFAAHDSDKALTVTVEARGKEAPAKVELFDGAAPLGSLAAAPYTFKVKLAPGVRPLVAVATFKGGGQGTSAPSVVVVQKK